MDGAAIVARVTEAKVYRDLADLVRDLQPIDAKILFATLFPIAIRRQGRDNGPVAFSAYALHALNPPCTVTLDEAISLIAESEWDISIEEVPWYLANQFGADQVLSCVRNALANQNDEHFRIRLETVQYWVRLTPIRA